DASGNWTNGTACQFVCAGGQCTGVCTPGERKCKLAAPQECGTDGVWQNGAACDYGCEAGLCKPACSPGQYHCEGNEVQQCDPGPPPKWVPKSPATICSATTGQA